MIIEEMDRTEQRRPPPFPDDFGKRLERLKETSGLSWTEFAMLLGVTPRGLAKWRAGGPPSGAYFWAIIQLARGIPGGLRLMLHGDDDTEGEEV